MHLVKLGNRLFRRPELDRSAADRILDRENNNRRVVANLMKQPFIPLSMDDLVRLVGKDRWDKLVRREKERLLVERWNDEL
jgi:hypothetical protein